LENDLIVEISGRVESCDSTLFAQQPKVVISLICFDPDFTELESVEIEDFTVDDTDEILIVYNGSVETGILVTLNVDRVLTEFTIYHHGSDDVVHTLDFAGDLEADDILVINTVTGSKAITLTRSSVASSLLYGMSPQSTWIELLPGDNYFRVYATGDPVPFTLEYTTRYGGL
jgi:hypothetical protein